VAVILGGSGSRWQLSYVAVVQIPLRVGFLNLFKHVSQLINKGSVNDRLCNSDATTVAHSQSR